MKKNIESKDIKKEVLSYVKIVIVAVAIAIICNTTLIVNATIPSESMEDTIQVGDRIIGFRLTYKVEDPQRGDIIIFKYPDDESQTFIKRIIGLPGETVQIIDGKVYIDDAESPLEEDYVKEVPLGSFGPYVVPEDSYFVLGDNRNDSKDSRYWNDPFVKREKILAKAIFQYYPKMGKVE